MNPAKSAQLFNACISMALMEEKPTSKGICSLFAFAKSRNCDRFPSHNRIKITYVLSVFIDQVRISVKQSLSLFLYDIKKLN